MNVNKAKRPDPIKLQKDLLKIERVQKELLDAARTVLQSVKSNTSLKTQKDKLERDEYIEKMNIAALDLNTMTLAEGAQTTATAAINAITYLSDQIVDLGQELKELRNRVSKLESSNVHAKQDQQG